MNSNLPLAHSFQSSGIVLLGLGPGNAGLLTRQAWNILRSISQIYLRTNQHPVVESFPENLVVHSFDYLYENSSSFEDVYEGIVNQVLDIGQGKRGIVYGVPGHPFIAEATGAEILRRARMIGLDVKIVDGLSFLEPVYSALGADPFPQTSLVDAFDLIMAHHPLFPPDVPALIAQISSKEMAAEIKITLMTVYPDEHPVAFVHRAGTPNVYVENLPLYEIDHSTQIGLLSCLHLPALRPKTSFESLQEIVAHLRSPDGCPWDRDQTHSTLRPHLLEETYETLAALDSENIDALAEELGDLLFQIVIHAQIASEFGEFTMAEVLSGICEKLIRRHPHVYDDMKIDDLEEVLVNWERLKESERNNQLGVRDIGILDSVPNTLPALAQSTAYLKRAARVGFDWLGVRGKFREILEEIDEIVQASDEDNRGSEFGDLFYKIVNLADHYGVDAESALRGTNMRFREKFMFIERYCRQQKRDLTSLSMDELHNLWEEANSDT